MKRIILAAAVAMIGAGMQPGWPQTAVCGAPRCDPLPLPQVIGPDATPQIGYTPPAPWPDFGHQDSPAQNPVAPTEGDGWDYADQPWVPWFAGRWRRPVERVEPVRNQPARTPGIPIPQHGIPFNGGAGNAPPPHRR